MKDLGPELKDKEAKLKKKVEYLTDLHRLFHDSRCYRWVGNDAREHELRDLAEKHPSIQRRRNYIEYFTGGKYKNEKDLKHARLRIKEEEKAFHRAKDAARPKAAKEALKFLELRMV